MIFFFFFFKGFFKEVLSENDFEAFLATFSCYEYGANASEKVQKIATDQKDYHKCFSCVILHFFRTGQICIF